ncbi:MAG: bifunctional (p)ppGpp synthetase/guanosine-3',5'-bis(diphosphate) 3'-pyrophosphohydrolase [Prevotella sp.]|nr:bifunctional (p)ppGpp synthetase/guanosine-3',5'-bis(diphosphate) 3'-pyrophosphohydrolase [Prevotella sp.]MBQ9560782.1 bifunctional (p)ppGpp synthetase/guanosine-3',5'-bis(diphosphate) 3'-pyrophosphohydrolase [Prevotella sp.]
MLRRILFDAIDQGEVHRDVFGLNPLLMALQTAYIAVDEIGLGRDAIIATVLYNVNVNGNNVISTNVERSLDYARDDNSRHSTFDLQFSFGEGVNRILHGLGRVQELYKKTPAIESENFRNLLLSFAEDMRVILIMIADRVNIMREIRDTPNVEAQQRVAQEASYLYAPLAHKLGLYKLKSELEDLSLKYLEHDAYYHIKDKLSATKEARDTYIYNFIGPVRQRLEEAGLNFHIKGRTKSIHSIWQKMKKQKCPFEGVYDLFAIRIILDSPQEKEKMECWQAYSIVTDMYQPNPKRLRDWLSVPKSNGYESLHITVLGPEKKWVEVQIRTERMDDIAEHGLAAHWRYKGIKGSGGGMDQWLSAIRTALEAGDDMQVMDNFRKDLYDDEVFVFTPKGDIKKFAAGATVLDFAYNIHSRIGNTCVGARVNGKAVPIREPLHSGDTVEIMTNQSQKPKRDWLNIAQSSHARAKIRKALSELERAEEEYVSSKKEDDSETAPVSAPAPVSRKGHVSASEFVLKENSSPDVLIIDRSVKGIDYSLARCCHPIYGDDVFGFVTVSGGIKIHRMDCPNAAELRRRFGYRIVKAQWSGKAGGLYHITLRVIGNDDISIVNTITSVISKEEHIQIRSINIDSDDGLFRGNITVAASDNAHLASLIRKIQGIKGVRAVSRV